MTTEHIPDPEAVRRWLADFRRKHNRLMALLTDPEAPEITRGFEEVDYRLDRLREAAEAFLAARSHGSDTTPL